VLGIVAAILIFFVLSNRPLPLITNDRAALIALVIIGFAMCTVGGSGKAFAAYGWAHPITIIGSVLGVLILALVGARLVNLNLPLIVDDRAAFIAVAAIGVLKVLINVAAWALHIGKVA
jgi:hypothetical protein